MIVALIIDFPWHLEGAQYATHFQDVVHATFPAWAGVIFQGVAGVYIAWSIFFFLIQRIGKFVYF
jgi:hypothetical protein